MKRANSGMEVRVKGEFIDTDPNVTLVSIGGVRATGTLVAREGQSQP